MAIYEIILCILILLVSVLVCAVTLSMDKADKNSLSVITGISDTMRSSAKDSTKTSANKLVAVCTAIHLHLPCIGACGYVRYDAALSQRLKRFTTKSSTRKER